MIRFHWSLWNPTEEKSFLLSHSIATFKYFFGNRARYVVFTDNVSKLSTQILVNPEIYCYDEFNPSIYNIDALSTWKKWAPMPRIDLNSIEIHIDIDMFLINEPVEINNFVASEKKFLCMLENFRETWPYGNFSKMLPDNYRPINAGLLGQNINADISNNLQKAFRFWYKSIYKHDEKYHDEQGALLYALSDFIAENEVQFLPNAHYRNVSPFDPPVKDIKELVLIHATCDGHPAFYKYINSIKKISGLPGEME